MVLRKFSALFCMRSKLIESGHWIISHTKQLRVFSKARCQLRFKAREEGEAEEAGRVWAKRGKLHSARVEGGTGDGHANRWRTDTLSHALRELWRHEACAFLWILQDKSLGLNCCLELENQRPDWRPVTKNRSSTYKHQWFPKSNSSQRRNAIIVLLQ